LHLVGDLFEFQRHVLYLTSHKNRNHKRLILNDKFTNILTPSSSKKSTFLSAKRISKRIFKCTSLSNWNGMEVKVKET
jgi:hypothetical protein